MLLLPAAAAKGEEAVVSEAKCGSLQEPTGPHPPGGCVVYRYAGPLPSGSHCLLEVGFFKPIEGWACEELITGPKVIRESLVMSSICSLPPQGVPGCGECLLAAWATPKEAKGGVPGLCVVPNGGS